MLIVKEEGNVIEKIKKQENTYIMNLEANYIYRAMTEDIYDIKDKTKLISNKGNYSTKDKDYTKLFTATIPYSLEMIRLDEEYENSIYVVNGKQYTKSIVNITFDNNYSYWIDTEKKDKEGNIIREKVIEANKKKLREYIYVNGFYIDKERYVFYKRGASKARTGSDLFIKENMYEFLMNRSRLIHNNPEKGLYFKEGEECDITSLNAYQSLVLSGLEDIIDIPKESILIIDDINSLPFKTISSVTTEKNGKLKTETKEVERINNMTDGQGLLDESIFELANRSKKGMMLLRNDLFKCCAFNTKLQKFFQDMEYEGLIKDGKVFDKYRGWVDYKDIKLITTPSSVKYLKFKYKFDNETECYMSWFDGIDNIFGIVKSDKEGNYGTWNRTTYQIINSMPFSKDQIKELMKYELEYIKNLKTNLAFFKNHISIKEDETLQLENDISLLDCDSEEDFESKKDDYKTLEMINNILSINTDFQYTKIFKKWRLEQIQCYIKELRKGKIRLENTIYCTIVANPYEMLLAAIGKYENQTVAIGCEMYCTKYKDGEMLATFRNPHINSGNVMLLKNKYHKEYEYFNLSSNITIVNVSDNDLPDRGQGFDYDSDTLLHIPHKIFINVAEKCQHYKTPLNMVKGDSKKRTNTLEDLSVLDNVLSNNFIGKIINKSQIINSYMWDYKSKGMDESFVNNLYDISSMLSSLSQIELDKAKKSFDNISMCKELKKINDMKYNGKNIIDFDVEYLNKEVIDEETGEILIVPELDKSGQQKIIKKMIVPNFFKYVAQDNTYRVLRKFNTPMDYLEEILDDEKIRNIRGSKTIGDLLVKSKHLEGDKTRIEHQEKVLTIIVKCGKKINSLKLPSCKLNKKAKSTIIKDTKNTAINDLSRLKLSPKTLYSIMQKCFGENKKKDNWSKYGMLTLNLLYHSKHKLKILSLFKNTNNINEEILILNNNGDIDLFGKKYSMLKRNNIKMHEFSPFFKINTYQT